MIQRKNYTGIDYFRMVAAILIIMIHTSPLGSYSELGDFILTRVIARVAVPFFFLTSGFFLISEYCYDDGRLWNFVKKTLKLYLAAIVIYLPINLYNGYFRMENFLPKLIRDLLIDGTMYHLWYLPAAAIGAVIAWFLLKKFTYRKAFLISGMLYLFGLFGDSYYGIAREIPLLGGCYELIFQVTDHTRNGFFFAPFFFILGGYLADHGTKLEIKKQAVGFGISSLLMLVEALTLHKYDLQKHDSMYLFLIPTMYFLFLLLLHYNRQPAAELRDISMWTYILHPFVIVLVRLGAKIVHLEKIFIDDSLMHFIAVTIVTVAAAILLERLFKKYGPKPKKTVSEPKGRSYLEINLKNLEHNIRALESVMPEDCKLMAVLKANAYGHGAYEVATHANRSGVEAFAVATIDEGIRLRQYGIRGEILILGYTLPERAAQLEEYDLTQTLVDAEYTAKLERQGKKVKGHLKVDTGMHRLGFDPKARESIVSAFAMTHVKVTGIFTHLCAADSLKEEDVLFTKEQIASFYELLEDLKARGIEIPKVHIQSSYGLLNYPELKCDYVRIGIALYGVLTDVADKTRIWPDLKPVLALRSRIVSLHRIQAGESVGYNRAFVAKRNSLIASVPIGYADGYPRNLSNGHGHALVRGKKVPIIGKICMDQLMLDVTDVSKVSIGARVTLIGKDGKEEITTPMLAHDAESISNELLSRMGSRLEIVCIRE